MHWYEAQAVGVRGKSFVILLASLKAVNGNRLKIPVHPRARERHELGNERRGVSAHVHYALERFSSTKSFTSTATLFLTAS